MPYDKDTSPFSNLLATSVLLFITLAAMGFVAYDYHYNAEFATGKIAAALWIIVVAIVLIELLRFLYDGRKPDSTALLALGSVLGAAIIFSF